MKNPDFGGFSEIFFHSTFVSDEETWKISFDGIIVEKNV